MDLGGRAEADGEEGSADAVGDEEAGMVDGMEACEEEIGGMAGIFVAEGVGIEAEDGALAAVSVACEDEIGPGGGIILREGAKGEGRMGEDDAKGIFWHSEQKGEVWIADAGIVQAQDTEAGEGGGLVTQEGEGGGAGEVGMEIVVADDPEHAQGR